MTIGKDFYYPSIETERLYLSVLTLEDTEHVFNHFLDENITRYMDIEPCRDLDEAKEIIDFHIKDVGCRWGLYTKDNNEFIGTIGFHYLRRKDNMTIAEIGFDLAKAYWGKGLMTEAIQTIIKFGFEEMKLNIIDATVEPENKRCLELMDRLGFSRASELKDNLVYFSLNK